MAKGIPLMGRDPDGKAKMINVDENGNVKVQKSGHVVEQIPGFADATIPAGTTKVASFTPPEWARGFSLAIRRVSGTLESVRYAEGFNGYYSQAIAKPLEFVYSGYMHLTRRIPFRGDTIGLWITAPAHEDFVIQFAQIHWWGDNDAEAVRGYDPETGKSQPITLVKDPDSGLFYLGTAQVGHVGYDEFNDSYKVDVYNKTELLAYHEVSFVDQAAWNLSDTAERWTTSSSKPLDVRKYNKLFFVFQNNHNSHSALMQIYFYDTLDPVAWGDVETKALYIVNKKKDLEIMDPENYIKIPSGEVVFASEKEYPELAYPGIGVIMRGVRSIIPSEGSMKVWVFGK